MKKRLFKDFIKKFIPYLDIFLLPFVAISGFLLKIYRRLGSQRLKKNTSLLRKIGIFPIRDHYYEPLFNNSALRNNLREKRFLPGIDFRYKEQVKLLENLTFQNDFQDFLRLQNKLHPDFAYNLKNGSFEAGDAEFLFNYLRFLKPSQVIEVGCGESTKIISHALQLNEQDYAIKANHSCIEPFEQPWLDSFRNIQIIRSKIEDIDHSFFSELEKNDLLFLDSSHVIRPQGDIIKEYLEIIPSLNSGVIIHVHDIFSPHDYLEHWIEENVFFWNEQYILESTLSNNSSYEIIAALNFLKHESFDALKKICPFITKETEPGSFYFKKV